MSLYKIADLFVEMDCVSEPTVSRCAAYKVDNDASPNIIIKEKQREAEKSKKETKQCGLCTRATPDGTTGNPK